jgi:hypothetical protein
MSEDTAADPAWLTEGIRYWDRASDLAQMLDEIAGADEVAAGHIMAEIIRAAPPDEQRNAQKLCIDADSLRWAVRIQH